MWCHLLLLVPFVIAGLLAFLPWTTALPVAMGLAMPTGLVVYAAWRTMGQPVVTGAEGLRGSLGKASSDLNPDSLVRLRDELRLAETRQPVAKGQAVEVMEVGGDRVQVRLWT